MMSKTLILASVLAVSLTACNKNDNATPAGSSAPSSTAPAPSSSGSTTTPPAGGSGATTAPGGAGGGTTGGSTQ